MLSESTVLRCPLCDYYTGVARREWGVQNARSALVSHLCRKAHGKHRAEARVIARRQEPVRALFNHATWRYEPFEQPPSVDAVDPHGESEGTPSTRENESSSPQTRQE